MVIIHFSKLALFNIDVRNTLILSTFAKKFSKFKHVTTEVETRIPLHSVDYLDLENGKALKNLQTKYPHAHGTLNNIMTEVSRELQCAGTQKMMEMTYRSFGTKDIKWACQCHITWPDQISFSGVGKTKQDASRIASLKVLQWLTATGKVKDNRPVLFDKKFLSSLKKVRIQISLYTPAATKLMSLLDLYYENIKPMMDNATAQEANTQEFANEEKSNNKSTQCCDRMVDARNKVMQRRVLFREQDETMTDTLLQKEQLPIYKYKKEIVDTLKKNHVLIIKGEPGCGKSTQVPQYILDDFARAGRACDATIIVTQPRRLSAISLAQRVANERNEAVGDTVGYQVRFQSCRPRPPGGSITYCSSGILLRTLQINPYLEGITHVILDEAHERDVNTDMLMLLLRRVLASNPALKVLIMSATINSELFQRYYYGSQAMSIPGFTYPVQSNFLEDIHYVDLSQTKRAQELKTPRIVHDEIAQLIRWIDHSQPAGAILCFLPGWQDIKAVSAHLQRIMDPNTTRVLPLHSRLTYDEQVRVFYHPPNGVRKIILSTNVAETSITIDDVVYVVDTGVHKEERLSDDKVSVTLGDNWVSQANVEQRRGRAGRVRPGESYHLLTRARYDELPSFPVPEIHRTSLQKVVLDLKTYNSEEKAANFLLEMPEPPTMEAIKHAVFDLQQLGALTTEEMLTSLGRLIARFSTSPRLSKTLIYATIFNCLEPMLTVTSILSADVDLFTNSLEERDEIVAIKRNCDESSDHLACLKLYNDWHQLHKIKQSDELFCIRNMLRSSTLNLTYKLRQLSINQLKECSMLQQEAPCHSTASNELIKAVFLAGTQTFLFQRSWDIKNGRIKLNSSSFVTETGKKAQLAADCVCYKVPYLPSPLLTYYRRQESVVRRTNIVRDASSLSVLALPLFFSSTAETKKSQADDSEWAVMYSNTNLPFIIYAPVRDAELVERLKNVIKEVVSYFVEASGRGHHDQDKLMSHFRDDLVLALSELLTYSTHTICSDPPATHDSNSSYGRV